MKRNKSRKINKTLLIADIVLVIIILLAGGYLYVAHQQNYWPFEPEASEVIQEETVVEETTVEPIIKETEATQEENSETEQSDDGFVEGKTPVQYEGQTDNSNAEFNNEQFRIPEEEL